MIPANLCVFFVPLLSKSENNSIASFCRKNNRRQSMITIEQLKNIKERTEALHRYLDIEEKNTGGRRTTSHPSPWLLG